MSTSHHPTTPRYQAIVFLGPPGSGKGTQARILGEVPGYAFVSMGEILRKLDPGTRAGRERREIMEGGGLVPTDMVISTWLRFMQTELAETGFRADQDILALDGLPRNTEQVEALAPHLTIQRVVHLQCENDEILLDRIRGRKAGRQDDRDDRVIRHRFEIYRQETEPLLGAFPPATIATVDAAQPPLHVLGAIVDQLMESGSAK
ncbi:adenylate kinase [soil metagenome]